MRCDKLSDYFVCLVILVLSIGWSDVRAQTPPLVEGMGMHTCEQMFEESQTKWKSNRAIAPVYQNWVQGFLGGMNVAHFSHVSRRPPFLIPVVELRDWLFDYCTENPDHNLLTATVKLYYSRELDSSQ